MIGANPWPGGVVVQGRDVAQRNIFFSGRGYDASSRKRLILECAYFLPSETMWFVV